MFCEISQQLFLTYIKRDATLPSRQTNSIAITFNNSFTYINSGAMFPAWSPTRWTCCARTGKIESSLPLPGSSVSASAPRGRGKAREKVIGRCIFNAYRSGTFGIKASGFCAPIFFSPQLSWAPSTPTRPRASCCWTRKSNPHHSKTPDAYKRPGSACQKNRVCFKTIKLTKAECKR